MKLVASLCFLALCHCTTTASQRLGAVFLVLMTDEDAAGSRGTFVLEDNYCLDPVLPRDQSSCRIRVMAPKDSLYSESRISQMSLDFQHPSKPNTACHVRWGRSDDVRSWCEETRAGGNNRRLPAFREEASSSGVVTFSDLLQSEKSCSYAVKRIRYYRDGLNGFPERRPTVVFQTTHQGCVAGIVSGRRQNLYRTTEAPCVYNKRRRCRPLTAEQYDSLVRDVEASETFADFRTSSARPGR